MANTYYPLRVDTQANMHADVKAALLDYYGAYNDPANLDGVAFLYDTSPYLIFTCTAIADKPIRFYSYGVNQRRPFWSYGSGYTAGTDVDDPVRFSGTYEISTSDYITVTEAHLVLGPHTLFCAGLGKARLTSFMAIIGELTNGDYAAMGMCGNINVSFHTGCLGYNMTDGTSLWPVALEKGFQSATGKLFRQGLILANGAVGVELNGDGSIASFQDIHNASFVTTNTGAVWGAAFVLTYGSMYMDNGLVVLPTCLLMEYEEVT